MTKRKPDAFGYHATTVDALPSIAVEGLLPNDGTRGFWPDEYDVIGRLFLCDELDGARHYAETIEQGVGAAAILRFPLPGDLAADPLTDGGGGWWTADTIEAAAIDVLRDGAWMPLSDGTVS